MAAAGALFFAQQAMSAGFEKVIMWSGEYAGVAGAATSNVTGAQSLYFNPAGLARGAQGKSGEISLNFSPTFAKYEGPIVSAGNISESKRSFSPIFGAVGSYRLSDDLGLGFGAFVSGGTKAIYENVDFGAAFPGLKPEVKSDLNVVEFSAGVGYELLPGLALGLSWRAVMVSASLSSAAIAPVPGGATMLTAVQLNDLSKTKWNGFRLGAQYLPESKLWGLGANWRTPVQFTAEGTGEAQAEIGGLGVTGRADAAPVSATNTFPSQVTIGGFYDVAPDLLRFIAEFAWTEYSVNQRLEVSGSLPLAGFVGPFAALNGVSVTRSIDQNWSNQINMRFGTEFRGVEDVVLRAGYAYTSKVTPEANARATFSSPGAAYTLTVGAGTQFADAWDLDGAVEYSAASGDVTTEQALTGEYSTHAYTAHVGVGFHF